MQTTQVTVDLSLPFESLIDMIRSLTSGMELKLQKFDGLLKKTLRSQITLAIYFAIAMQIIDSAIA
jgi:hypothetical protein